MTKKSKNVVKNMKNHTQNGWNITKKIKIMLKIIFLIKKIMEFIKTHAKV